MQWVVAVGGAGCIVELFLPPSGLLWDRPPGCTFGSGGDGARLGFNIPEHSVSSPLLLPLFNALALWRP